MADMYKIIDALLQERGISGAKMSADLGMSRSFMTELRKGRAKSIKAETAQRIADYFGVSTDYLLGNEDNKKAPTENGERNIADAKAAFFDGYGDDLSEEEKDELWEDARIYAKFKAQQKK